MKTTPSGYARAAEPRIPWAVLLPALAMMLVLCTARAADAWGRLETEIAQALTRQMSCAQVDVKLQGDLQKKANPAQMLIRLKQATGPCLPAETVTVQYTRPVIDLPALRKQKRLNVKSQSAVKIGMLFSQQSLRHEFEQASRRLKVPFTVTALRFTPPHIELEFTVETASLPPKDRKLVERFIRNNRLAGYAAVRLELQGNRVNAIPDKLILNHFLVPKQLVAELKKRMNPVYTITPIPPFRATLGKVDVMKQYIYLSN